MTTSPTTITDVARVAGVSKAAVSFALNDKPGVAAETRERILAVARELGWTPSLRGRALSVSRALAVGLVIARTPETLRGGLRPDASGRQRRAERARELPSAGRQWSRRRRVAHRHAGRRRTSATAR